MHNFIWKYKSCDSDDINKISDEFNVPKSIATIMSLKNINSKQLSRSFFYSDLNNLHSPLLMKDMDKAIDRLIMAKDRNQVILIIGDYDTDGTTAASVLHLYFQSIGIKSYFYIPHRQKEGYGISKTAIDYGIKIGANLIISCDCGITAIEQIDYANENDIDFIITDHHIPEKKSFSYPILNPVLDENINDYSGAGVAWILSKAIYQHFEKPMKEGLTSLATIGTVADVAPLKKNNRIIVKNGLIEIAKSQNFFSELRSEKIFSEDSSPPP